ncbi:DUF1642 domain-containing protein [Streptococcus sp. 53]|uniref:DUF1642 domain-containing protein n=1 Tax=Streptococcus sp. 53 TaxID=2582679 RepID=UPI0015637F62|nr:DUF1642 domain-containing protein [Streptococcus sp. 53]
MNKQELIDYCNVLKESKSRFINCIDVDRIIDKIKQLDEPKPVKVPPLVSVWYRINKDNLDKNIAYLCSNWEKSKNDDALFNWMSNTDNFIQILVNMHQFGYEVEKEKQYLVKIKATKHYLAKDGNGKIFFSLAFKGYFTKKELEEAGFGWVFDCPGIEIEEVEV